MRGKLLFLLFFFVFFNYITSFPIEDSDGSAEENLISIESTHMNYEKKTILMREVKVLTIRCDFKSHDISSLSDLKWKKEGGDPIGESSSPSLFTTAMKAHDTHYKRRILHFNQIHKRDEGTYVCEAKDTAGNIHSDKVNIIVLETIPWNDKNEIIGGLLGEPLTIDCGVQANGDKEPHIEVTNGDGEALDTDEYTVAGTEVTIQNLSKDFNGRRISCVHVEMVSKTSEEEYPVVDRKDVEIVVWYAPEFDSERREEYTIIGSADKQSDDNTAMIHCNVTSSNPSPIHYTFYRGSNELNDHEKYELIKNVGQKLGAILKIKEVNQEDLGEYTCEVNNGKAKASQTIALKEASPPPEPKVTLEKARKHSLKWKVESVETAGELPVKGVDISYIRKSIIHDLELSDEQDNIQENVWKEHGKTSFHPKTDNNIYEVTGLRQSSEYMFRFRLQSDAGSGDDVIVNVFTAHDKNSMEEQLSSSTTSIVYTLTFVLSLLSFLLF